MKRLEKGFTLIELMIVVAIIAILAAVAVPKFGDQIKKSKDAKGLAVIGALRSASSVYYVDHDGVASTDIRTTLTDEIDDASADLVTDGTSNGALVVVGTNENRGTLGDDTHVHLDAPNGDDGTIAISDENGTDTKGTSWAAY